MITSFDLKILPVSMFLCSLFLCFLLFFRTICLSPSFPLSFAFLRKFCPCFLFQYQMIKLLVYWYVIFVILIFEILLFFLPLINHKHFLFNSDFGSGSESATPSTDYLSESISSMSWYLFKLVTKIFDLLKAFGYIKSGHKSDLYLRKDLFTFIRLNWRVLGDEERI